MTEPLLILSNLSVTLARDGDTNQVLDAVDCSLGAGEILAVVGESGSGKSTIGLAIQGLLPREATPHVAGSIRLGGTQIVGADARTLRTLRRERVRAIPQDPMGALNPTMTIARQMREALPPDADSADWLERVGLRDPQRILCAYPHILSGGQRQRVLIAMAMAARPLLVIADEPTTALDVTVQAQILELLRALAAQSGTAVLFITHDLGVAATLADRILVLYAGRAVETGPVREVIAAPAHPYTAALLLSRFDFSADRARPLPTLPGESAVRLAATGCPFAPRCPVADPDPCTTQRPPLAPPEPGQNRAAACHFPERAPSMMTRMTDRPPWPKPPVSREIVLEFDDVSMAFDDFRVLESISFRVRRGESVALVGESGSGKSTILRLAAGLLKATGGSMARAKEKPQVVFQDAVASLTPWLSVGEQIGERLRPLRLKRAESVRRITVALEKVGLGPEIARALPSELSGGQCQRVAVARTIVVPPPLLLCDEPISAMDVSLAAQTLNLLGGLRRELGMGMVFVTHDLAAARIIADRIMVLEAGRLVEDGETDAMLASPRSPYTRALIAAMPTIAGAPEVHP